jgi:hypothetical protein
LAIARIILWKNPRHIQWIFEFPTWAEEGDFHMESSRDWTNNSLLSSHRNTTLKANGHDRTSALFPSVWSSFPPFRQAFLTTFSYFSHHSGRTAHTFVISSSPEIFAITMTVFCHHSYTEMLYCTIFYSMLIYSSESPHLNSYNSRILRDHLSETLISIGSKYK